MAGALTVRTVVKLTGLGESMTIDTDNVTMTVPVEHQSGYNLTDAYDSESLQLSTLAPELNWTDGIYGLYIKAESGTIYVLLDTAGATAITSSTAEITLNEGEANWISIDPDNNAGIVVNGASASDAFSWLLVADS